MIRVSLAFLLGLAFVSRAQANPVAEKLAADATAAAASGNFKAAAELFAQSYKEDPTRSDVFCNIGISYFKIGELPRAHLLLTQCVQRSALDLAFKDNANAVITSIEQQMRAEKHTPVTISVRPDNATITVTEFGPESQFVGARTIWLRFGTHHLEAKLDGYAPRTMTVETVDQNPKSVEVVLGKVTTTVVPPPPKLPPDGPSRPSKIPPVVTSVVTVAALVGAVISFKKARTEADRAEFALDAEAFRTLDDTVGNANLLFGISTGVFVVAGAASGYLWYRATRSPSTTVEVQPTAGGAAVSLGGRF